MTEVRSRANAREARLLLATEFKGAIDDFQDCTRHLQVLHELLAQSALPFDEIALRVLGFLHPGNMARGALATWHQEANGVEIGASAGVGPMQLFVRVRPLMHAEAEHGEYECASADVRGLLVHDGRIAKDGRSLYMVHRRFNLGRPFMSQTKTAEVYEAAVRPLVSQAVEAGDGATVLLWGQTGTGKTHTATGILQCFADDLFSRMTPKSYDACADSSADANDCIRVRAFEMVGTKRGMLNSLELFDLLSDRKKAFLRVDENDRAHVRNCSTTPCSDVEAFKAAVQLAFEHRMSTSVERNEQSSRSHMFVEVILPGAAQTTIRIGDLAGSERNYEVQYHSKARHVEGGDINASLMALKDCIRLRRQQLLELNVAKQVRVPYRSSKLTLYLKECFTTMPCSLIATTSPASADVDHTINTLVHMTTMRGIPGKDAPVDAGRRAVFRASKSTVESRISKDNTAEWNVLNRWDHVKADEDIYNLDGADGEALVWLQRHSVKNSHEVQKWSAAEVQAWLEENDLREANIPSTMTGSQLCRLGAKRLESIGGTQGHLVVAALQRELELSKDHSAGFRKDTQRIFRFGAGPPNCAPVAASSGAAHSSDGDQCAEHSPE